MGGGEGTGDILSYVLCVCAIINYNYVYYVYVYAYVLSIIPFKFNTRVNQ